MRCCDQHERLSPLFCRWCDFGTKSIVIASADRFSLRYQQEKRNSNSKTSGLELLLNLTFKITSSLNLREVMRAIPANIRANAKNS
jgi:hypothetical protein